MASSSNRIRQHSLRKTSWPTSTQNIMASSGGIVEIFQGDISSKKVQSADLKSVRLLGRGSSSIMYETTWEGQSYARKDFLRVPSDIFEREGAVLVGLDDHPNVVRSYCWTVDEGSCSLVSELMDDSLLNMMRKRKASQRKKAQTSGSQLIYDLEKFIEDCKNSPVITASESDAPPLIYPFEMPEALQIILQIAEGMEFIHDNGVVHGDLKPKNILVTPSGSSDQGLAFNVKVADFGLVGTKMKSKILLSRQARDLELLRWRAPELLDFSFWREGKDESNTDSDWDSDSSDRKIGVHLNKFTYYSDVFNFALACSQILTGEDPFSGLGMNDLVREIPLGFRPELPPTCPEQLRDLIESCWGEMDRRPSFKSIVWDLKLILQEFLRGAGHPLDSMDIDVKSDSLVDIQEEPVPKPPLGQTESLQFAVSEGFADSGKSSGKPGGSSDLLLAPEVHNEVNVLEGHEVSLLKGIQGESTVNMSDYLKRAQALAGKLPSGDEVKLYRRQCSFLQKKLLEALDLVEKRVGSYRDRVQYRKVFKELHLLVQKVKTFAEDCCYEDPDINFVLGAIRVTAHKERFYQYHVELDWCIFLVECLRNANPKGKRVHFRTLQQFEWNQEFRSLLLRRDTSDLIEADESDLRALLRLWIVRPGEHQAICWALLRRLTAEKDLPIPQTRLEVPRPLERRLKGRNLTSKGGIGKVYGIRWKNKSFAVKVLENRNVTESATEVKILGNCSHPRIVNLILAHKKDRQQYLMMERLSMDLLSYIEKRKEEKSFPFPALEVVDMITQVCEGMVYLNGPGREVSHRNLNPRSILVKLVNETPDLKELQLADFASAKKREKGLGKSVFEENTPNVGMTIYKAPEMTRSGGKWRMIPVSSMKADIYSFAMTCSCILTGREPSYESARRGKRPILPDDYPPALASLLRRCWHPDPTKRPVNFYEILTELRNLKANLLTSAVDKADQPETSEGRQGEARGRQDQTDRSLRILVLGDSKLVRTAVCGPDVTPTPVEGHVNLTEHTSSSPPMCLYSSTEKSGNNFTHITAFVKARNNRWRQKQVQKMWIERSRGERLFLFPDKTLRLHMVWYVCRSEFELPSTLMWSKITKELYGLPVQILILTGEKVTEDHLDSKYNKIVRHGSRYFPNAQNLEELIVKVDPRGRNWKESLWSTCFAVRIRAEIENAAEIITWIREKLGPMGESVAVGLAARTPKAVSLSRSAELIFDYLCSYWDVDWQNLVFLRDTIDQKTKRITVHPRRFVLFCLQVAAIILSNASNPEYVYSWVPPESLEMEAQACLDKYFAKPLNPSAYDEMTLPEIRVFLQSIFERQEPPSHLVKGLSLQDSKSMERGDHSSGSWLRKLTRIFMGTSYAQE